MLKLHVPIFILTSDTPYLSVYLVQLKKGEGYDVYISIKSQVPDIQRHAPSKIFKFYFWRWFSVIKFGLTFKINHRRMLISIVSSARAHKQIFGEILISKYIEGNSVSWKVLSQSCKAFWSQTVGRINTQMLRTDLVLFICY